MHKRLNSELNSQIDDPQIIMSEIKAFYSKLYKKTSVKTEEECLQYLSNLSTPVLTEDEKSFCEGKLTLNECWEALNSMKMGKVQVMTDLQRSFTSHSFANWGYYY